MDGQMKKGILEMCILFQLSNSEIYGYEIMKKTKEAFPDVYDGTIYTILRRLHSDGYTETYMGSTSNGPQRKYYRITPSGREYLDKTIGEWKAVNAAVAMIGIR